MVFGGGLAVGKFYEDIRIRNADFLLIRFSLAELFSIPSIHFHILGGNKNEISKLHSMYCLFIEV